MVVFLASNIVEVPYNKSSPPCQEIVSFPQRETLSIGNSSLLGWRPGLSQGIGGGNNVSEIASICHLNRDSKQ